MADDAFGGVDGGGDVVGGEADEEVEGLAQY